MQKRQKRILKDKRRLQLETLHQLLDLLEFDLDAKKVKIPISGPAKLYAVMLVGALIRSLNAIGAKIPKSIKRAQALGISVNLCEKEVPLTRERKRLKSIPSRDDDDGGVLA